MSDAREAKRSRTADAVNGETDPGAAPRQDVFVGSVDQGTTSTRFLIFNSAGEPLASHQTGFDNKYPQSGYVGQLTSN